MNVRIERFYSPLMTTKITLAKAIEVYGRDELIEYLQGYHPEAAFFLETEDGQTYYSIDYQDVLPAKPVLRN